MLVIDDSAPVGLCQQRTGAESKDGKLPCILHLRCKAGVDSVSVADEGQGNILQNVYVYDITEPLDPAKYFSRSEVKHGSKKITKGTPVINGSDSLTFDFTTEFAKRYLTLTQDDMTDLETYTKKFPGIYLTTNDPIGLGGRFNMFKMNILEDAKTYKYRSDNYAILYYTSTYDGERKDTTLMFYFSPLEFQDLDKHISNNTLPDQYVFNVDYHESDNFVGNAGEEIIVEGGSGVKPVISANEIKRLVSAEVTGNGGDPATGI